jgi:hypothetical protein
MDGRRIDLSATQVVASMLAAITGAVAASTLGIAGTIIGAAIMSVASTAVAAVYKHYIARSKERLRKAAEVARVSPLIGGGVAASTRGRHRAGLAETAESAQMAQATSRVTATEADADKTQMLPVLGSAKNRWHDSDRANDVGRLDDATRSAGRRAAAAAWARGDDATAVSQGSPAVAVGVTAERAADVTGHAGQPSGGGAESGLHGGNGGPAEGAAGRPRRQRPLVLAGIALGIFLLAIAGITAFETIAGKPLDALVGGKHGSGTTIGNLVGGQGSHTAPHRTGRSPAPSPSSTPTPSPSTSPGVSPSPSTSPSPTPTPAGTPTPTAGAGAGAVADTPAAAHRPATPNPRR